MWWGFRPPSTETTSWPWAVGNQPAEGDHVVVDPDPPPGPRVGRPHRNRQEIKRRRKQARR